MKYFSIFSGIGGFELGIQQILPDAECVGFSEVDKWAVSIYQRNFKGHKNYGDATKIIPKELPDFDILVGGFPCQTFSIAGKRSGFGDTRGLLFFEIARVIEQKKPRLLVLENVKGLLSHDKGRSYATIISTLDGLGYDTERKTCNSKYHGVPQNRDRAFIIGHLRASRQSAREVFPIANSDKATAGVSGNKANTITARYGQDLGTGSYISGTEEVMDAEVICYNAERGFGSNADILSRKDKISYALTKTHANHLVQIVGGSQGRRVYDPMGIAVTQSSLGSAEAKTELYAIDSKIRKLMPIECERLQGFPDNWTKYGADGEKMNDKQRYKCIGNAVTVNVIADIFYELKKGGFLEGVSPVGATSFCTPIERLINMGVIMENDKKELTYAN